MGAVVTTETDFYKGGPFPRDRLWVRPHLIGSTEDEAAALRRGEVAPERASQIQFSIDAVFNYMRTVPPQGFA